MFNFADFLGTAGGKVFKAKVGESLKRDVEGLARALFGEPKKNGSGERGKRLRFSGGVTVELTGRKRGSWYCWTSREGGGPLQMIAFARRCDDAGAWEWGGRYTRIEPENQVWTRQQKRAWARQQKRERELRQKAQIDADERDRSARITKARAIWEAAVPIAGTLGEKYLTSVRNIPAPPEGWPLSIRYHAGDRAIVFAATDDAGEICAVHRIFLTATGGNRRRADGSKFKQTDGDLKLSGAIVRLPGKHGISAPLLLAEGAETGLSGWRAKEFDTWVLLGALSGAKPPRGRLVIGMRDDDKPDSPADRDLEKAVAGWRNDRINITLETPWPERRGDKSDFNDLLREQGLAAVSQRLHLAVLAANGLAPANPPFPLPTATAAEIHTAMARALRDFFARRGDDDPPRLLLASPTGTGKTEQIGQWLPNLIEVDKAKGRPHRVIVMVPAHRLGQQIAERYRALAAAAGANIAVSVYEGRGDPWQPASPGREYLCDHLDEVGLALKAGADIADTVCGSTKSQHRCPARDICRYFAQFAAAATADILIVAHNFVFEPLPQALLGNIGCVVIEEDFSGHGLGTVELPITTFDDKALAAYPVLDKNGQRDQRKTSQLDEYYGKIERALGAGPLSHALAEAGLTKKDIKQARGLSWKRKIDPAMRPGMPLDDRRTAALVAAKINPLLPRIVTALHAVEELAPQDDADIASDDAGRIEIAADKLTVYHRREPARWLASLPVLVASASLRPDLVRRFFPTLECQTSPAPALPHQTVRQYLGAFGKRSIGRKLPDFVAQARLEAARGRSVLVICHMQDEAAFAGIPSVRTLHHGNVAGDNDFGDVDLVIQIGGPFAPPTEIAHLASAETGRIVPVASPVRTSCAALLTDGTGVTFERLAYADPAAQAVHASIYDTAFVQGGLGRGRGINRSANTPLEIRIYGNVPLPVPVAGIERYKPMSRLQKMLLDDQVHLNAHDMHRFSPALFASADAARQAIHRWGGAAAMRAEIRQLARQFPDPWIKVTWQPNGQGYRPRTSFVASPALGRLKTAIAREFPAGLAVWQVAPFTAGRAAPQGGKECDKAGKETSFPAPSQSSPTHRQGPRPAAADATPRAPPDG